MYTVSNGLRCGGMGGVQETTMPSDQILHNPRRRPWNKGQLVGQKRPLKPKDVWAIRIRLELGGSWHLYSRTNGNGGLYRQRRAAVSPL